MKVIERLEDVVDLFLYLLEMVNLGVYSSCV
jgi:hypothetical protein